MYFSKNRSGETDKEAAKIGLSAQWICILKGLCYNKYITEAVVQFPVWKIRFVKIGEEEKRMGSLDGLKVLDFSTLLPGPYATLMLADMGAEVLKVSSASKPDIVLDYPPFIGDTDVSACQAWLGRNKKTMFLNLKTKEAVDIVKQLVKEYDIVLEQFRPGVMEKLGLGYEDLKKRKPRSHLLLSDRLRTDRTSQQCGRT